MAFPAHLSKNLGSSSPALLDRKDFLNIENDCNSIVSRDLTSLLFFCLYRYTFPIYLVPGQKRPSLLRLDPDVSCVLKVHGIISEPSVTSLRGEMSSRISPMRELSTDPIGHGINRNSHADYVKILYTEFFSRFVIMPFLQSLISLV